MRFLRCAFDCLVKALGYWAAVALLSFLVIAIAGLIAASGGTLAGLTALGSAAILEILAAAGITAAKLGGAAAAGTFLGCIVQC